MASESIKEKRRQRRKRRKEAVETPEEEEETRGLTESKGRATPSRRKGNEGNEGNFITRPFNVVIEYFQGVASEIRKVTWPTREEATRLTYLVLAATIASSLALGGLAIGFTRLFSIGVSRPLVFLVIFVVLLIVFFGYIRISRDSLEA